MKIKEHVESYCSFWKPSVARRITLYFLIFGLIIFFATAFFFTVGARKHFMRSTSKMIHHQFSQLENSNEPDFIWYGINHARPDLYNLMAMLESISASFYRISDISIYSKDSGDASWSRLFFGEDKILRASAINDAAVEELNKTIRRRFRHSDIDFITTAGELSMFVDITGKLDTNYYFLKIGIASEAITGLFGFGALKFIIALLIAMGIFRLLGYYFARKISRPIENLSEAAAEVAKGDLSKFVPVNSNDELGELATNFNKMIEGLREWERIKVIEFELEKGQQIQKEFLPSAIPTLPNWEIATCFYPAGKVSGDFYDVFRFSDESVGLVIADVCDKGVGSALYMALFRSLIRVFAEQAAFCNDPAVLRIDQNCVGLDSCPASQSDQFVRMRAVPFTNNYIAQTHGEEGMFATLFFGVLNPSSGVMCYINGGHEPLYVINSSGIKASLAPAMPDSRFKVQQINLEPGDVLVGYTDGVTEARSPQDETFSRKRLQSLLEQPFNTASDVLECVKSDLFAFIDIAPRHDDVTMLAVQHATI
jgi:serine phosphatase RsbU (regulator of sigma subunit)